MSREDEERAIKDDDALSRAEKAKALQEFYSRSCPVDGEEN